MNTTKPILTHVELIDAFTQGLVPGELILLTGKSNVDKNRFLEVLLNEIKNHRQAALHLDFARSIWSLERVMKWLEVQPHADVVVVGPIEQIPEFFDNYPHLLKTMRDYAKKKNVAIILVSELPRSYRDHTWPGNIMLEAEWVWLMSKEKLLLANNKTLLMVEINECF